jgi:glycine dehydrogenase subunit 1
MGGYLPSSQAERSQMLRELGLDGDCALYRDVPDEMIVEALALPDGLSELEVSREMRNLAAKNNVYRSIFRGAGAYNHYIPSIVKQVTSKEEFVTAYTPYQAEISQGILQSIFEYQTLICELTGLDASNASVYDGATAAAEAVAMCCDRKRPRALVAASVNPQVKRVLSTYCEGYGYSLAEVPEKGGRVDPDALKALLGLDAACLILASPNFYGLIEDAAALGETVHAAGAKLILSVNPIASALYKSAGELGADIAVGEGQPLGMPLSFGGPYLGFMAAKADMMRKLPGRIVGETTDKNGNRAFVLTLQAREQHIRREKAGSNICSNQALCAMTASVYAAATGAEGLVEVARQCHAKAEYLAQRLSEIGYPRRHTGAFFHEFLTETPVPTEKALAALREKGILGGLPVSGGILWCATEMNTKADIDELIGVLKGVRA